MAAAEYYNTPKSKYSDDLHPSSNSRPPFSPATSSSAAYRPEPNLPSHFQSPFEDSSYTSNRPGRHYSLEEEESRYHDHAQRESQDPGQFADDIPLRPQPPPKDSADQGEGNQSPTSFEREDVGALPLNKNSPSQNNKRRSRRNAFFGGRIPWVVYCLTLIQVSVFIAELVKNAVLTKTPIEIHPQFNPMLGPSPYVLINMGARYVPCMRSVPNIQNSSVEISWPCPNTTSADVSNPSNQCTLSDLCGFSGVPNPVVNGNLWAYPQPNQWFRFIVPIFLHAGIIHITFNMLLQILLGREIEKIIGSLRFALVYFSSGIFGFVMGGNFAPSGIASTGASGSLFGVIAIMLLDLLYTWKERKSPVKDLAWILLDIIIAFVLGLLPGLDNFSHIGGFVMGLALGICILHSPNALRRRIGEGDPPYTSVSTARRLKEGKQGSVRAFVKEPAGFFKGRKPLWWAWWFVRAAALVAVLVLFVVLINNFYKYRTQCSWCKYLSCINVNHWCEIGNIQLTNASTSKRDLFTSYKSMDLLFS